MTMPWRVIAMREDLSRHDVAVAVDDRDGADARNAWDDSVARMDAWLRSIRTARFSSARARKPEVLTLALANRHGLVTGATGTGKTVTLQVLAEGFSRAGVPVFAADIKGDLSGIAAVGEAKDALRRARQGDGLRPTSRIEFPVVFWDLFGEQGHPVRATVSEMGPLLLSRLMDLNDVQEGVLNIAFRVADEQGLLLLDLKDLRAMLAFMAEQAERAHHPIRQRVEGDRRHHPAPASGAGEPGRRRNSSASRRSISRTSCAPTATAAASSISWPPTS